MDKKILQDTAKKHAPKQHKVKHAMIAFITGGMFAILAQLMMLLYQNIFDMQEKTASSLCVVTIIAVVALLTGVGVYDTFAQKCGAGLFVPISGFANSLTSCAMEGKTEGLIYGIGGNMFKLAGSVLTYGIAAACVFGTIRYLIFGG